MGMQGSAIDSRASVQLPASTPQNVTPADIATVYDANVGPRKGTATMVSDIIVVTAFTFFISTYC